MKRQLSGETNTDGIGEELLPSPAKKPWRDPGLGSWYFRNTNAPTGPSGKASPDTDSFPAVPADKNTPKDMTLAKGTAQASVAGAYTTTTSPVYTMARMFVGPALVPQVLTGGQAGYQVGIGIQENNAAMNLYHRTFVYVWRSGSGNVKTMLGPVSCGTEHGTTERGCVITANGNAGDFQIQQNDRIVVEEWWDIRNTKNTSYTATFYYDGTTDVVEGTATSNAAGFFYSPQTLLTDAGSRNLTCNCVIQVALSSGSITLSAQAGIRNQGFKALSCVSVIRNSGTKELSASVIVRQSSSKDLSSETLIRNLGFKDLSSESQIRNRSSGDLSSTTTIRKSDFENLSLETTIRNKDSQELPCNADIHQILQSGLKNLSSQVIIRNLSSIDLPSNAEIRRSSWIRISLEAVIRNKGEKDLSSEAIIQGVALNQLSCMALIRNASSKGLPSSASVRNKGSRNLTNNCFISLLANDLSCQAQIGALVPEEFAIIKGEIIGDEQKAIIGAKVIYQEVS